VPKENPDFTRDRHKYRVKWGQKSSFKTFKKDTENDDLLKVFNKN